MSKIKLLLDVVEDMCKLADSLRAVAECIQDNSAGDASSASDGRTEQNMVKEPTITEADIRAVLAEKTCEGKTDEARELLGKYGSKRVKDLNPSDYPAFIEEARKL